MGRATIAVGIAKQQRERQKLRENARVVTAKTRETGRGVGVGIGGNSDLYRRFSKEFKTLLNLPVYSFVTDPTAPLFRFSAAIFSYAADRQQSERCSECLAATTGKK